MRDALAQQERGLDCVRRCGLDLARSGAHQRAVAERERALARAGVRIRGQAVRAARGARGAPRCRARCGPCSPSSEETLTCSSAPSSRCGSSRSSGPRDALGVGEQQAVAEAGQAGDGGVEDVVEALERALEQQPRRVLRALGDQRELALGRARARPRRRARRPGAGGRRARPRRSRAARPRARSASSAMSMRGKCARLMCGVQATSSTPSACSRRAKRRVSSIVAAPSSRPGRRWRVEIDVSHSHKW